MSRGINDPGGYFFDEKAERKSWEGLEQANGDWAFHDACDWYARLMSGRHYMGDLKLGAVKLYVGAILHHATLLSQPSKVQYNTVVCSKGVEE